MDKSWGSCPHKFNSKRFDDYKKYLSKGSGCPVYHSKNNAKIPKNLAIYERDNYTPFGVGYRRCPGEFLSLALLEEMAKFVKDKSINIYLNNNQSKKEHYVFDLKETNYIIELS